jgi:uncharacterized membrane protein
MFPAVVTTLLGLVAAVSWGLADFFAARASRRTSPEATSLWVSAFAVLAFVLIYLISPGGAAWTTEGVLYAAAAGICLEIGLYVLFRGLAIGPVSIVTPISSAYPLLTTLIIVVVFGGSLRLLEAVGIVVAMTGVILAARIPHGHQTSKLTAGAAYAVLALVLWGLAYAMLAQAVAAIGWQKATLVDTSAGLAALVLVVALTSGRNVWRGIGLKNLANPYVLATSFVQVLGGVVFTVGLEHARSASVITAISAIYPVLTIFLAMKYLKEKKRLIPLLGAGLAIAGVVLLSL